MNRRHFIQQISLASLSLTSLSALGKAKIVGAQYPRISLAQWSLHRAYENGQRDPLEFAATARNEFGLEAVEYVASFYQDKADDLQFWNSMNTRSADAGVKNLLIMVDGEGLLAAPDRRVRKKAVQNHYKWVDAAKTLGCHSIRVNAFGTLDRSAFRAALMEGLADLCAYGAQEEIEIIIENHGLFSSDAPLIASIIKDLNLPNLGTLPDFGNWCMSRKWGSTADGSCAESYDRYNGVAAFMPFARGVSAKSYDFADDGTQPLIDYGKMFTIVRAAGFIGHVGIEYEGNNLSEEEGIRATKRLIEKTWKG